MVSSLKVLQVKSKEMSCHSILPSQRQCVTFHNMLTKFGRKAWREETIRKT